MIWDIEGDFAPHLTNPDLKIPEAHRIKVCKYRQGSCACRYIAQPKDSSLGFICVKNMPLKIYIDEEATNNPKWKAKGNNCDGFGDYGKQEKTESCKEDHQEGHS